VTITLRALVDSARFTAVTVAHELRRDYERGVFSRQTLGIVGVAIAVALVAIGAGELGMAVTFVAMAGLLTYASAQADRRWRDDRRNDP